MIFPEGPGRHLNARGKNCRETICAAQLPRNYPHCGGNFERAKKSPLLWGRGNLGSILRDNLGEGNCESKIARDSGESIFAARHQDVSQGPLGSWESQNGGLRPHSAICAQLSAIVHFCGLFGSLCKVRFRHNMTTIIGNRGFTVVGCCGCCKILCKNRHFKVVGSQSLWFGGRCEWNFCLSTIRCVTPYAAKTCAVRPVFGRVVAKLGAADPRICPKGHKSKC